MSDALCRAPGEPLWVVAFAAVPGADHTVIVSMAAPDALCPVRGRASMGPVAHIAMENLVKGLGFRPPILGAVGMCYFHPTRRLVRWAQTHAKLCSGHPDTREVLLAAPGLYEPPEVCGAQ